MAKMFMVVGSEEMTSQQAFGLIRWARLVLGGAVLGIAVAGVVSDLSGATDKSTFDMLGAFGGGALAGFLVKIAHIA